LGIGYCSFDQPFAEGQHQRQPGGGIDHAGKDPAGDQVAAPAVGQAGHQGAKGAQAHGPSQVVGKEPGQGNMQRQLPAKGPLDGHQQKERVRRIKGRRLQVGGQGGACAQVGVPQRPVPGTNLIHGKLPPGEKLEQVGAPVEDLAAKEERRKEDQRQCQDQAKGTHFLPYSGHLRTSPIRRESGRPVSNNGAWPDPGSPDEPQLRDTIQNDEQYGQ